MTEQIDFVKALHDLVGLDEKAVEKLIDQMDTDQLQALSDAIAKNDRDAVDAVMRELKTDEDVNALFRGQNLDDKAEKKRRIKNLDGRMQFAIGDDVSVDYTDEDGKPQSISATVEKPDGPEGSNTIIVKIKGKKKVVDKRKVHKLEESVLGMVGLPNLARMQQLAGIAADQPAPQETLVVPGDEQEPAEAELDTDTALAQAMAALDMLAAVLPNIKLCDAKSVRERLSALQVSMNETARIQRRKL